MFSTKDDSQLRICNPYWLYLQFTVTHLDFQLCHRPKNNQSKVVKYIEKMRNELKRMKKQFYDFLFFNYGLFCTQKSSKNWFKNDHISKTKIRKNRKIYFSLISAHCAYFQWIWPLLNDFFFGRWHTWKSRCHP